MIYLELDVNKRESLGRQFYTQIRLRILNGILAAGLKLPSTRAISQEYHIARNTVIEVYEQLNAEGFLISKHGSGTYVNEGAFFPELKTAEIKNKELKDERIKDERIKREENVRKEEPEDRIDFSSGSPDISLFPRGQWARCLKRVCDYASDRDLDYGPSKGDEKLCLEITKYLQRVKGIDCSSSQVFIFDGSFSAIRSAAEILTKKDKTILVEKPLFTSIMDSFKFLGLNIFYSSVDEQGIQTGILKENKKINCIAVTPSHQYPTGMVLTIQRRLELIKYVQDNDSYILENDYDSEFRYSGYPVPSLYRLDPERVIHIGTFSESMFPAMRVGYMVVPAHITSEVADFKSMYGHTVSLTVQRALTYFIQEGYLEKHIAKMKRLYKQKQQILLSLLKDELQIPYTIEGATTGLYVVLCIDKDVSVNVREAIEKAGIAVYYQEDWDAPVLTNKILIGFGAPREEELKLGVPVLADILNKL